MIKAKMSRILAGLMGGMIAALMAIGAHAATLTPNGEVLVNKGNGFARVGQATEVKPGDMVMINSGNARLVYPSGRSASLEPGKVYTVGNDDDPHAGALFHGAGGLSTGAMVVGGVAIVGGVIGIVAATKNKSSSP